MRVITWLLAAVLVSLAAASADADTSELMRRLEESSDMWSAMDLHSYCYTTEVPYECATTSTSTFTVTDDVVAWVERQATVCDGSCENCQTDSAGDSHVKDFDAYTLTEWYEFCRDVALVQDPSETLIYFVLFDDAAQPELTGLLQMCGYKPKNAGNDHFVGVTIRSIGIDGPSEDTCTLQEQGGDSSTASASTDPEGGDEGSSGEDNGGVWENMLSASRSEWEAVAAESYCYVTEDASWGPCAQRKSRVTVDGGVASGTYAERTCNAHCSVCSVEHGDADALRTIDEWYDWCANEALQVPEDENDVILHFFEGSGLLQACGYTPHDCEDSCWQGVDIIAYGIGDGGDSECDSASEIDSRHSSLIGPTKPHSITLVVSDGSGKSPSTSSGGDGWSTKPHSITLVVSDGSGKSPSTSSGGDGWSIVLWTAIAVVAVVVVTVITIVVWRVVKSRRSRHPYEGYETYHPSDWI